MAKLGKPIKVLVSYGASLLLFSSLLSIKVYNLFLRYP